MNRFKKQAFTLSAAEREVLANHLYQSVHPELTETDHAWLDLAEKRYQDFKSGKSQGLTESEFFESIEKELGWS